MTTDRTESAQLVTSPTAESASQDDGNESALNRRSERIGVFGATGMVGQEFLRLLHERHLSPDRIIAFSSERHSDSDIPYGDCQLKVYRSDRADEVDFEWGLLATDARTSRELYLRLHSRTELIIDNSSAFRQDPDVPLVVPEINGHVLESHSKLVANPNCSTIILLTALEPIRRLFGIRSIRVATYQAVSGAGKAAVDELIEQTEALALGRSKSCRIFPVQSAFNVFAHESTVDPTTGYCDEELKMIGESRRLWNQPDLPISVFCARVPVLRAHSQSVWFETEQPVERGELITAIKAAPGLRWTEADYGPTPLDASHRDDILVGRLRMDIAYGRDFAKDNQRGSHWNMFVCGDQLRKGAALNALQILETIARCRNPLA